MHRLVYLTYMLMVASAGVTFVFLEDIETDYGLPAWGIGLISALGFGTAVFTSLLVSPLGDRGRLGALGGVGFAAAIVGNTWIGFATDIASISASRALAGVGAGVFSVVGRKALIGTTTEASGEKIGMFLSAAVAGFIAGPGIGAQLAEFGGIKTPYLTIAVTLSVIAVPTIRWLESVPIATSVSTTTRSMLPLLRRPGVRAAAATQVAVFFNIGVFDSIVDEYLTDLGASNARVGLVLLFVGAPLLIIPRLAGRVVDRSPRPARIMLLALTAFVPILFTLSVWVGIGVFLAFGMVQTTMESIMFPSAARVVINETGAEKSAVGQGLLDAVGQSAAVVSAFFAPILYDFTDGPLGPFLLSGSVALVLLVGSWRNIRERDSRTLQPAGI